MKTDQVQKFSAPAAPHGGGVRVISFHNSPACAVARRGSWAVCLIAYSTSKVAIPMD